MEFALRSRPQWFSAAEQTEQACVSTRPHARMAPCTKLAIRPIRRGSSSAVADPHLAGSGQRVQASAQVAVAMCDSSSDLVSNIPCRHGLRAASRSASSSDNSGLASARHANLGYRCSSSAPRLFMPASHCRIDWAQAGHPRSVLTSGMRQWSASMEMTCRRAN